ncbi:MAG: glutamate--tRNA ligase [Candidatus Eisenbacteria bacterium RBG_16_71_46]|nr:MAG: glutamate--tRNA ligase [Candidatus Eisenbacteria bacterium RBG_16_71_46]
MSVRVRFAPSPTGWLHVGGARTAYFNWLFARQRGGRFVVRIEDTDVERSTPESESGVLDDLRWLGLDWDEGPDVGGPEAPYRQSERLEIYRDRARALLDAGRAYPCFCTDAELEARRGQALAAGRPPHYDGHCRRLGAAEREAARGEGRPESVRFAVAAGDQVLHDGVRGEVRFPEGMVGDFVLLRSNGRPTYNFACVVDDAGMGITDVIRAEEHLSNTGRQLMLYGALGLPPPRFAHVPLILNRDRSKMSKRTGEIAVAVGDWRRAGFVPEALLSYLALLGFHPGDEREILSRAEMLEAFTLERVGRSGAVFDPDKLRWVNAHALHHASGADLAQWGAAFLPDAVRALPPPRLERVLEAVRGNLATLADLPSELAPLLGDAPTPEPDAAAAIASPQSRELCAALARELEPLADWSGNAFKSTLLSLGKRLGVKGRDLFQPVRAALTGRTHGPELPLVAELLGRGRCVARLRAAAGSPSTGGVE